MTDELARSPAAEKSTIGSTIRELGPVVSLATIFCATVPAIAGFTIIGFAPKIRPFFDDLDQAGPLVYAGAMALTTGLALTPTYALSGVAGFFFGFGIGSGAAMSGIVGGALIGYLAAWMIARRRVMEVITRHDRARVVRAALVDRGFWPELGVITLLRLPPNSPFAITNLVLSSTRARPDAYLLGTAMGIAPRTLVAVFIGASAGEVADATAKNSTVKIAGIVLSVVVVVVLYALFSRWSRKALNRRVEESGQTTESAPE